MMQINLSTGAKRCVRRVQYQSVAKTESQIDEHQTQSADKTESQSAASTVQASSSEDVLGPQDAVQRVLDQDPKDDIISWLNEQPREKLG